MKLSEVIALIGAGYTKAEIEAFEQMDSANKPEAKPDPKPDNSELLTAINGLTKALQLGNIRNTPQPNEKSTPESVAEKADKALLEIYNL